MLKNSILLILITVALASALYANFDKITGYTTIVIEATVTSPTGNTQENNATTLTASVSQPQKETEQVSTSPQTIVSTVEPVQEKKEYINQTVLLKVINQTESLRTQVDKLRTSSRDVLNYYSSVNDTENAGKWINVVTLFNQALDDLEDIHTYTESVKDSATQQNVSNIKVMISDVLKTLGKITKLIKNG